MSDDSDLLHFNPQKYLATIYKARDYLKKKLERNFVPKVCLTLGSGGLGKIVNLVKGVSKPVPFNDIPGFLKTTVEGHTGNVIFGYLEKIPVMILQGRKHYYELGDEPNQVITLKTITFPVYVAKALGCSLYIGSNAAGGLNPTYKTGDLMLIKSHVDLFFPNPLIGPQVNFADAPRFQPQNNQYNPKLRQIFIKAASAVGQRQHLHEGVYCALTGPTYESQADSQMLRKLGADCVGMSTVPEIIVASNLGMETLGLSLITNVIAEDGTNATSHKEVMSALSNNKTKERILTVVQKFFYLLQQSPVFHDKII